MNNYQNINENFDQNKEMYNFYDKTNYFFEILKKKGFKGPILKPKPSNDFMTSSSNLDNILKDCQKKLIELKQIENRASFFNSEDNTMDILSNKIGETLKESQFNLTNLIKSNQLNFNSQTEQCSKAIYDILQSRILQITQELKKTLKRRTENIKNNEEKKTKLSYSNIIKPNYLSQEKKKNRPLFLKNEDNNFNNNNDIENSAYHGNGSSLMKEENTLQNRFSTMQNIEGLLREVGSSFQRLGNIVKMHEVMIDRIDKYTDDSLENTKKGRKILTDHYRDISSNRELIIKIFGILLIFVVVYILFLL